MTNGDYEGRNLSGLSLEWLRDDERRDFFPPTPDPYRAIIAELNHHGTSRERRAVANALSRAPGDVTVDDVVRLRWEQGDQCSYCGADLNGGGALDHIFPVCRGGNSDAVNMAWSCQKCNAAKSDKTPAEWDAERWLAS